MNVTVSPAPLTGTIGAIPSKSDAHRLLICAALADKPTVIHVPELSADIEATARCLAALGAEIVYENGAFTVNPLQNVPENPALDCGESGSTLRFLLPVAAALSEKASFAGRGRLPERPISDLAGAMKAHGVQFSAEKLPFSTAGRLAGGDYCLPGNVSSQYITGLLLALPLTQEGGRIHLTTSLESAAYVDMTVFSLGRFGVEVKTTSDGWSAAPQHFISPGAIIADGDWSSAACFLTAGAIGGKVTVTGLDTRSTQGDKAVLDILRAFGAAVSTDGNAVTVTHQPLRACDVDLKNIPDLLPALAVLAAFSRGTTRFTGGARLRIKESDRLKTVSAMINALGGDAEETADGLIVRGKPLTGGTVSAENDHRIAMAAAIAAAFSAGDVTITGAEAVNKSYPRFFEDFSQLGGTVHVI